MPNEALQQTGGVRSLFVTCSSLGPPPLLSESCGIKCPLGVHKCACTNSSARGSHYGGREPLARCGRFFAMLRCSWALTATRTYRGTHYCG
jgi:hypothetical protein